MRLKLGKWAVSEARSVAAAPPPDGAGGKRCAGCEDCSPRFDGGLRGSTCQVGVVQVTEQRRRLGTFIGKHRLRSVPDFAGRYWSSVSRDGVQSAVGRDRTGAIPHDNEWPANLEWLCQSVDVVQDDS